MAAAFELTSQEGWKERFAEVVVYQVGWRLGGKGAAGREQAAGWGERIEEHGLHIWAGMYHHAFKMMKACYEEWQTAGGNPRPFEKAFHAHSHVTIMHPCDGQWERWPFTFPTNDLEPGTGDAIPTPWEFVKMLLSWVEMITFFGDVPVGDPAQPLHPAESGLPRWVAEIVLRHEVRRPPGPNVPEMWEERGYGGWMSMLRHLWERQRPDFFRLPFYDAPWTHWMIFARSLAYGLPPDPRRHLAVEHQALGFLVGGFISKLTEALDGILPSLLPEPVEKSLCQMDVLADLGSAMALGIVGDGLWIGGFDKIDDQELSTWLEGWGAKPSSLKSGLMRAAYEYVFAFEDGDPARPSQAAGTALRGLLRLLCTYKGAFFWKMMGSMGQVVFTPLYEVLKKRGVRFEFFHRVRNLGLSSDGQRIATLKIGRQASPPAGYPYLSPHGPGGLDDWPNEPAFDVLPEGTPLKLAANSLESAWSTWTDVETVEVVVGEDDAVVLGIGLGELPRIGAELVARHPGWAAMVQHVKTVRTCALQLWFEATTAGLGWPHPGTLVSGYQRPFATWGDFTHVLDQETWPGAPPPGSLAYLVGVMPDGDPVDDFGNPNVPFQARVKVEEMARAWLDLFPAAFWPAAIDPAPPKTKLDFSHLHDPMNRVVLDSRFNAQYWRANVEPSDRYVQYVPGSVFKRRPADDPAVHNLYLAGDWVRSGLNAGCVESAVMAGIQAARAILGLPGPIPGSQDL